MKLTQTLRLIELFAGYGSQALALEYLGIPFEHHFVCEFDAAAMKSYNEIHGTNFATSDVSQITAEDLNIVDRDQYKYLLTYSFPCTDLSLAGKRAGMARDSGTRSSLLWQVERLLDECGDNLPQYLMMENVPQVIGQQNIKYFKEWTMFLCSKGYQNYYQIMNAEDYGVPQHRERVIMISILKSENQDFVFPKKTKLTKTFEDLMEHNVDEKYYLSQATIDRIREWKSYQNPLDNVIKPKESAPTLVAAMGGKHCVPQLCEEPTVVPTLTARGAGEMHAGMQLVFDNNEIVDIGSSQKFWSDHRGETSVPTLKTSAYLGVVENIAQPSTENTVKNPLKDQTPYGWHFEQEVHDPNGSIRTLKAGGGSGNIPKVIVSDTEKSTWTPSETNLITADGNVKTYTHSDEVQEFEAGQVADLSFPGGYGHGGGRIYDVAPTLTATSSRSLATKETIKAARAQALINQGDIENGSFVNITYDSNTQRTDGVAPTLTTRADCLGFCTNDGGSLLRIRKLTPRECFRLMGVKDEDYNKLTGSDQQKYKQAGNSIVVDVLMAAFYNLFIADCKKKSLF